MSTHTPLIRLQAARTRYQTAQENCAHWDYEDEGLPCVAACCDELRHAQNELRDARRARERAA